MRPFIKKYLFSIAYGILLLGFTAYVLISNFSNKSDNVSVRAEEGNELTTIVSLKERTAFVNSTEMEEETRDEGTTTNSSEGEPGIMEEVMLPSEIGEKEVKPSESVTETDNTETLISDSNGQSAPTTTNTPTPSNTPTPTNTPTPIVPTYTENGYTDEHMSIQLTKYREYNSDIYVVDIKLDSPEYLRTATTGYEFTTVIAERCGAIVAINGDCFRARKGYCIRNGQIIRDTIAIDSKSVEDPDQQDFCLFADGHMEIIREGDYSCKELLDAGVEELWSFGPGLVKNGVNVVDKDSKNSIVKGKHPRTAIGIIDDLHYVFIVVDGRTSENAGVTCYNLAEIGVALGVDILYNLDGGQSSALYFNGRLINYPAGSSTKIGERTVNDIVYIGY